MNTTEATRKATVTYPSDTELLITREFDAPRSLVLEAITQPEHVQQWYGMSEDGMRVCEIDFRVGGKWHYVLAGPPGEDDISFSGEYLEIDPPKGFRWTFMFDVDGIGPQGGPETFVFDEVDGRTRVTSTGHLGTVDVLEGALAMGMVGGAIETWDRLAAFLAEG